MPRAQKPRKAPESPRLPKTFDPLALTRVPRRNRSRVTGLGGWSRDQIAAAVDAQMRGAFRLAVQLQQVMLTEPAIFSASENRLAPHRGLARTIKPPKGSPSLQGSAASVLAEAIDCFTTSTSVALGTGVLSDDFERISFHGLYVDQVVWKARDDGKREDPYVIPWDLEAVEWSNNDRMLIASTELGRLPIEHGHGQWIVGTKHSDRPWRRGALVSLGTIWPDLAHGRRDRSLSQQSHGDDKWIGELPPGIALDSAEARATLDEMEELYGFQRASLFMHGTKILRNQSQSQAWQIFKESIDSDDKAAQKCLLGQDGTMTNTGGNYVKAWGMFGVRNDIIESDLSSVGAGVSTGLLRAWSLINFSRWDRLEYQWLMPDADEDARLESIAKRTDAFNRAVSEYRANVAVVDQSFVNKLAASFGVDPPTLADATPSGSDFYAYEIDGGIVTIDEVRARKGLGPLPNGKGQMTVPESLASAGNSTPIPTPEPEPASLTINRRPLRAAPGI